MRIGPGQGRDDAAGFEINEIRIGEFISMIDAPGGQVSGGEDVIDLLEQPGLERVYLSGRDISAERKVPGIPVDIQRDTRDARQSQPREKSKERALIHG
jgi:hypothetical protein